PAWRERRQPLRDGNDRQDEPRRADGRGVREDGQRHGDHHRNRGRYRHDRRRPFRRAGGLHRKGAEINSYLSLLRRESSSVVAVELRPPRAELEASEGMDAWIDTYHAIRSLTRHDVRVMVTDSAVGAQEENNLRHLVANLGDSVSRHQIIPFLTTKHSIAF